MLEEKMLARVLEEKRSAVAPALSNLMWTQLSTPASYTYIDTDIQSIKSQAAT
jgi:hypothetical protein